jgi:hypothetical protein
MELPWHLLLGGAKHGNNGRVKRDINEVFFFFLSLPLKNTLGIQKFRVALLGIDILTSVFIFFYF